MAGVDPLSIATAGLGLAQAVGGLFSKGKDKRELNALVNSRKAFQTPDEIFQILNATQARASNGLGAETINYLTDNINRGASSAVSASTLLGGDPNNLSAIFDQQMQGLFKVGAENHAANLKSFTQYLGALNTEAENKAAEQISADNLIKDKIQAKSAEVATDNRNISGGLNTIIGGLASNQQMNLYKDRTAQLKAAEDANFLGTVLPGATNIERIPDYTNYLNFDITQAIA